jgi:phosphoglycolate phosphatase
MFESWRSPYPEVATTAGRLTGPTAPTLVSGRADVVAVAAAGTRRRPGRDPTGSDGLRSVLPTSLGSRAVSDLVVGFDLDMTLIDSRPGVIATFDALNAELGSTIDGRAIASRLGPTLETEMATYFPPEEVDPVCDRYRALYAELGPPGSSLLPGAAAAVASVRDHAGTTAVITAKFGPNAHRCLGHVGLVVDHVVGWRHGPQKAETLLELGARVYVGDTIPDVAAAHAAGAVAIAVASGPVPADELRAAGADVVLESLEPFADWLATAFG